MRLNTNRFHVGTLLGGAFILAMAAATPSPLRADDKKPVTYHDKKNNDNHQWNAQEEKAYQIYWTENNRPYAQFPTLHEDQQQAYWAWRHDHSDAALKIEIK